MSILLYGYFIFIYIYIYVHLRLQSRCHLHTWSLRESRSYGPRYKSDPFLKDWPLYLGPIYRKTLMSSEAVQSELSCRTGPLFGKSPQECLQITASQEILTAQPNKPGDTQARCYSKMPLDPQIQSRRACGVCLASCRRPEDFVDMCILPGPQPQPKVLNPRVLQSSVRRSSRVPCRHPACPRKQLRPTSAGSFIGVSTGQGPSVCCPDCHPASSSGSGFWI